MKSKAESRVRKSGDPGKLLIVIYVATVILFVLTGGISRAAAAGEENLPHEISMNEVRQGELLFKGSEAGRFLQAPRVKQRVELTVSGMVIDAKVNQQFKNNTDSWLEAVYVFPLPDESAVKKMRMRVGNRIILGEIKEKEEARKIYEKAKQEGQKTSLLAQKRPNIFTMAIANIPPGETVDVEFEYLDMVRLDNNLFSLRFPLVVGPRYIPGKPQLQPQRTISFDEGGWAADTDQVEDAAQITPGVTNPLESPRNPVEIQLTLDPGFPVDALRCLYHGVKTEKMSEQQVRMHFDGRVFADRDFVVEYRAANKQQISASIFHESYKGHYYTYFMLMPPTADIERRLPRDVIFVLDKSGSMAGSSIRQAKKALKYAISRLSEQDKFNVIVFNNTARRYFREALPAISRHKERAVAKISALEANGGTEIAEALKLALEGGLSTGRIRQVIFLTDGAVGNERALFQYISANLGDARLFTVGIGSAPNSYFMSRAAAIGRGSFCFIGKIAEVESKMTTLFDKLEKPVVTGLALGFDGNADVETYPDPLPDLYSGEPVTGVIKSTAALDQVYIQGMNLGQSWSVGLDKGSNHKNNPGVATLWARKRIRSLMTELSLGAAEPEIRSQIVETALEHSLVSRYTSLIAVEQKITRPPEEDLQSRQITSDLPQGWQHNKVFGTSARTATHSQAAIALGCCIMLSGYVLLRVATRRKK